MMKIKLWSLLLRNSQASVRARHMINFSNIIHAKEIGIIGIKKTLSSIIKGISDLPTENCFFRLKVRKDVET